MPGRTGVSAGMDRPTQRQSLLAVALLSVSALAGCTAAPPSGSGAACEFGASLFDVGPVELCERAVALAQARLGWLHWPVTSITFRQSLCPPNARCAAPALDQGWVIFTFSMGDPSMIHVGPDGNGALVAGFPEPLPDWLVEERNQGESRPAEPQDAGG